MTRICCVPACRSNYPSTIKIDGKVPLFKFPTKTPLREAWIKAINKDKFEPTHCSFVCIKHFNKNDIVYEKYHGSIIIPYKYPRLIPNIVPSIFPSLPAPKSKPKASKLKKNCNNEIDGIQVSKYEENGIHCYDEVPMEVEEPIGSFDNLKSNVVNRLKDISVEIKINDEEVFLYHINIPNFTITRYIRISKELNGYFYPQSRSLEMLDQQFTFWSELTNAVKLFFNDSFEIPPSEKINDLLSLLADRTDDLLAIANSSDFKHRDRIQQISMEFKKMIASHDSSS